MNLFIYLYFRFVMVKYADRGLVNDKFFVNNIQPLKYLFWICNLFLVLQNQGLIWAFYFKHGKSFFANNKEFILCTEFDASKFMVESEDETRKPLEVFGKPVRTIPLLFGIAILLGIQSWRRNHLYKRRRNYNLLTFHQTIIFIFLIYTGRYVD